MTSSGLYLDMTTNAANTSNTMMANRFIIRELHFMTRKALSWYVDFITTLRFFFLNNWSFDLD